MNEFLRKRFLSVRLGDLMRGFFSALAVSQCIAFPVELRAAEESAPRRYTTAEFVEILRTNFGKRPRTSGTIVIKGRKVKFVVETNDAIVLFTLPHLNRELKLPLRGPVEVLMTEGGETRVLRAHEIDGMIKDTGLTLDEITLRFLFWNDFAEAAPLSIRGASCPGIRFDSPAGSGAKVYFHAWIDPRSLAPVRISSYAVDGKELRRFEVISVNRNDSAWEVKTLRISDIGTRTISHIEFDVAARARTPADK